ncbi:unnamed protein product [Prorocentrum cordatum]|uniref:Polynucleotide 5'-triphosphatase n=1 Tax=Prorocentrum cordatum TaxID=2364126 RepID=A0ABN9PQ23_9DINO|nr:unnamed protein product [Polarella glacialis]
MGSVDGVRRSRSPGRMNSEEIRRLIEESSTRAAEKAADLGANKALEAVLPKIQDIAETAATAAARKVCAESEQKMSRELAAVRAQMATASSIAGASTSGGTTATGGGNRSRHGDFIPQWVEIKGYIANWDAKEDTALLSHEVEQYVNKLTAKMDPDSHALIDTQATKRIYDSRTFNTKIQMMVKDHTRDRCWELKGAIDKAINTAPADFTINSRTVSVVVQLPPHMTNTNMQSAKFHGLAERARIPRTAYKIDYVRPSRDVCHLHVQHLVPGRRPKRLATYDGDWGIQQSEWEDMRTEITYQNALQELRRA